MFLLCLIWLYCSLLTSYDFSMIADIIFPFKRIYHFNYLLCFPNTTGHFSCTAEKSLWCKSTFCYFTFWPEHLICKPKKSTLKRSCGDVAFVFVDVLPDLILMSNSSPVLSFWHQALIISKLSGSSDGTSLHAITSILFHMQFKEKMGDLMLTTKG